MKIEVTNLAGDITDEDLCLAFEAFGTVKSAAIVREKASGQIRRIGSVEMESDSEGQAAIEGLHGTDLKGKTVCVSEVLTRTRGRGGAARHGFLGGGRGGKGGGRGDHGAGKVGRGRGGNGRGK